MSGCLSIIRTPTEQRTEEQKRVAFDLIFKADNTMSKYVEYEDIDINAILDSLQMLSKSRLMSYKFCPYAWKCKYILGEEGRTYPITQIGTNLHKCLEMFWNKSIQMVDKFLDLKTRSNLFNWIFGYIYNLYESDITDQVIQLIKNIAEFECNRILDIYDDVGQTKEAVQNYVIPIHNELGVENWKRWLCGWIDTIYRLTNESYVLVDYKFGKPKYMENEYNKRDIITELAFYRILTEGEQVYAVWNDKGEDLLVPLEEYLGFKLDAYYGAMIFFQDISTAKTIPLHQRRISNTYRVIQNYWDKLDKGQFYPRLMDWCWGYKDGEGCQFYWDNCEFNPSWKEYDMEMEMILDE